MSALGGVWVSTATTEINYLLHVNWINCFSSSPLRPPFLWGTVVQKRWKWAERNRHRIATHKCMKITDLSIFRGHAGCPLPLLYGSSLLLLLWGHFLLLLLLIRAADKIFFVYRWITVGRRLALTAVPVSVEKRRHSSRHGRKPRKKS